MTISLALSIVFLVVFFLILPTALILLCFYKKKALKIVCAFFFLLYFVFIMILVLGQINISKTSVTVSLKPNAQWFSLRFLVGSFEIKNILYNLAMMFPISFFVFCFASKKVFIKTIVLSFCFSLFIEFCQFVLPFARYTELLDLVLNTISGVLGYLYFYCVVCVFYKLQNKNKTKAQKQQKK